MNLRMPVLALAALLLATLDVAALAAEAKPAKTSWNDYRGVVRNNPFLKPHARVVSQEIPVSRPPPPTPTQITVLTGIVVQDGEYVAFLENTQTQATMTVRVGAPVYEGRVTDIALDHVEYVRNGATTRVEIGKNLEGADKGTAPLLAASVAPPEAAAAETSSDDVSEEPMSDDVKATLEKLRLKRLKEKEK